MLKWQQTRKYDFTICNNNARKISSLLQPYDAGLHEKFTLDLHLTGSQLTLPHGFN